MNIINKILNNFSTYKNNPFLIDGTNGNIVSYNELYNDAKAVASYFSSLSIKKGETIIVFADNSTDLAKIYFASLFSGIIVFPLNPVLSEKEINNLIEKTNIKTIVTTPKYISKIKLCDKNISNVIVFSDDKIEEKSPLKYSEIIINKLNQENNFIPFKNVSETDELILIYTSGTTSSPKGVVHSIQSLFSNGIEFCEIMGITSDSRFFNILSMTYLGGYYNLLMIPFISGGSVVINEAFSPLTATNFWKISEKYQVNRLWLVPTIMAMLLEVDRNEDGTIYCEKNIPYFICGTAPLIDDLRQRFENKYKKIIYVNYGLSETLFISINTPLKPNKNKGVGVISNKVEVKIVKDQNKNDKDGEIEVKTPFLMKGYLDFSNNELKVLNNKDFFKTGDIGVIGKDSLYITGRKKDLIIRGGINISPMSIENIISLHPDIVECAVIGIPHNIMGEDIIAIIKPVQNIKSENLTKEIKKLCKDNLSSVKQPSHILELSKFPKTLSGKTQKRKLKNWAIDKIKNKKQKKNKLVLQEGVPKKYYRASSIATESIEAISITYNNKVYEMKQRGEDVITLSLGEAFFDMPLYPFDDLPFPDVYHYSHSRGIIDLRENIAKYFSTQYDFEFNPENEIIITAGSKIAIHMSLMATVNINDEVLIPEPAWVSYFEQVKLCRAVPVGIPYDEEIFNYENYITNRTKVIIINNPLNPSGKVYNIEELTHIHNLALKYNLFIISDEAYSDFILDSDKFISMGNLDKELSHTIVCNSISKNYGISGWRIGYLITNESLTYQILKINQHLITCPATILEMYIAKHFFEIIEITKPQIQNVVLQKNIINDYLDEIGLKYLPGIATFYTFVSIEGTKLNSIEFCDKLLDEDKICVVPGIGYGASCGNFVRIAVGTESIERIKHGLDKVKELIKKTK